ncbi:hypothetical protein FA13DRAFT_1716904 [Coprinellus micaceus]|uniref:Uncharacterized protein n=1 Tax=Coprinellus micaceus TaxID=71717 RepID=A0A4Y7SHR8_COPMI|nr:hypothetical protein FA13DRAFT_1716904 [Coprinellus micaceus]
MAAVAEVQTAGPGHHRQRAGEKERARKRKKRRVDLEENVAFEEAVDELIEDNFASSVSITKVETARKAKPKAKAKADDPTSFLLLRVSCPWKVDAYVSALGGVENSVVNGAMVGANTLALFLKPQRNRFGYWSCIPSLKKFDEVIGVKYLVGMYLTESLNDSVEVGVLETRTPSLLRVKTLAIGCVLPWGVLGSMEVPLWRGWETRRKQWKCRGMRSMEEMVDEIRKAVGNSRGIRVRMRG